ncbi:hypothetical protein HOG17_02625 [Candidatus Peregrinibacteria bacterium]|nr:hypothetical protein [Candidatus Peregrinibacteria bacterium]MBT4147937.1 hypothetical protein [Candidatus Peregrinibacteria bacterium]MBT4366367.1 hypothetical protein [Candidatus Peregrinibacteria bacterium]MBT4456103.1 hypothetical protein [Candidatus Peregrinibacteria bacterium]
MVEKQGLDPDREIKYIGEGDVLYDSWPDTINKGHVACAECPADEVCKMCEQFERRLSWHALSVNYSALRERALESEDVEALLKMLNGVAKRHEGSCKQLVDDLFRLGAVRELALELGSSYGLDSDKYSLGDEPKAVESYGRKKGVIYDVVLLNVEAFAREPMAMLFVAKYDENFERVDLALDSLFDMEAWEEIAVLREHAHDPNVQLACAEILDRHIDEIQTPRAISTVIKFSGDPEVRGIAIGKYRELSPSVGFSTDRWSRIPADFEGEIDYTPFTE